MYSVTQCAVACCCISSGSSLIVESSRTKSWSRAMEYSRFWSGSLKYFGSLVQSHLRLKYDIYVPLTDRSSRSAALCTTPNLT